MEEASEALEEEPHRTARDRPVTRTMVEEASELRGDSVGELPMVGELALVGEPLLDFQPPTLEHSTSRTVTAASVTRIMARSKTGVEASWCSLPGTGLGLFHLREI